MTTEVDDFFADVRTLDPHDGLASGILDLLLDRIEARVRDVAGSSEGFSIGFTVSWSVDYWTYDVFHDRWDKHTNHFSEHIELARVHWDLDGLLPLLRRAVNNLAFVEQAVTNIANALLTAIGLEGQAAAKDAERNQRQVDRDAATHTQNESSCIPTRIEILEPAQSALYEGPVTVTCACPTRRRRSWVQVSPRSSACTCGSTRRRSRGTSSASMWNSRALPLQSSSPAACWDAGRRRP